jgi:hypothetical protein
MFCLLSLLLFFIPIHHPNYLSMFFINSSLEFLTRTTSTVALFDSVYPSIQTILRSDWDVPSTRTTADQCRRLQSRRWPLSNISSPHIYIPAKVISVPKYAQNSVHANLGTAEIDKWLSMTFSPPVLFFTSSFPRHYFFFTSSFFSRHLHCTPPLFLHYFRTNERTNEQLLSPHLSIC